MSLRAVQTRPARRPRLPWMLAITFAGAGALLAACEGPMRNWADQDAYSLIQQRQQQVLGDTAESRIGPGEVPAQDSARLYNRVPPTINTVPAPVSPGDPAALPQSGAATASAPATTQAATNPSIDALLANLPGIDLSKMPELPVFPRPVPGKTRKVLTLDDAFGLALAHNRDYATRKEDLYLAALNVTLQRHLFELRPFASSTVGVSGDGESSDYAAAFTATQSAGVRQRLPMGGEVVAQALVSSIQQLRRTVGTREAADVSLAASIPLLRGAGTVAQEDLIATERELVYEVRDFERFRRGFLVSVANQYFNLVNQRAQIVNRFRNVKSYIFITERSKALFEAGMARRRTTLLDVMRAAQSEYQARSSLINAIESYELSLDRFKLLLGIAVEDPIDVAPQYLTMAPPQITEAAAVDLAGQLRLDLQTVRDRVDDARRGVKNAANGLLPDLNLSASVGASSDPSVKSVAPQYENLDYATSITMNWPLDRVAERNTYRRAVVSLDRAKRDVETAESQVASDVRAAVRAMRQQQVVLSIQKSNIELAQKRKEFSDIQFRDGKIDNRDYLDAETALLDAQNSFARALSDLEISVLQYLRDTDQLRVDFDGRIVLSDAAGGTTTSVAEKIPASQAASRPAGGTQTAPAAAEPALVPPAQTAPGTAPAGQ